MPGLVLKKIIMGSFDKRPVSSSIADSIDFMVETVSLLNPAWLFGLSLMVVWMCMATRLSHVIEMNFIFSWIVCLRRSWPLVWQWTVWMLTWSPRHWKNSLLPSLMWDFIIGNLLHGIPLTSELYLPHRCMTQVPYRRVWRKKCTNAILTPSVHLWKLEATSLTSVELMRSTCISGSVKMISFLVCDWASPLNSMAFFQIHLRPFEGDRYSARQNMDDNAVWSPM